jgi:Fe(3+) dicitrate transport protein
LANGEEINNIKGNHTPYAPEWLFNSSLFLEAPFGLSLILTNNYVSEQFADGLNTFTPSADGRIGKLDSYMLFDATAHYKLPITSVKMAVNVSAKNLTDERYIASRRPQGIRVGMPRMITAGIDIGF